MKRYVLDRSQAIEMQISNDAFFYLLEEEEPLDEANLEEAQEILAMFPNGFVIDDGWKPVEDSDLIEAVFVPYVPDTTDYDEYFELTNQCHLQIKWLDTTHIRAWQYNVKTGTRELKGDYIVTTNEYGLKYFHTGDQKEPFVPGKSSLFFLKHFKKKQA
jgi:hypothetical protein